MTIVEDTPDRTVTWFPLGARWLAPTTPPHRERVPTRGERLAICMAKEDWVLEEFTRDMSSLWIMEAGAASCVWVTWLANGEFLGWYVNLQEPFVRTSRGFTWMDQTLDVTVDPDGTCHWKDEDEFEVMQRWGHISPELAVDIRKEGLRRIAQVETKAPPFDAFWTNWRPDTRWPVPELPPYATVLMT